MHNQAEIERPEIMPLVGQDRRVFLMSAALGVAGGLAGVAPLVRAQDQACGSIGRQAYACVCLQRTEARALNAEWFSRIARVVFREPGWPTNGGIPT